MVRTMKEIALEAIRIQDASNLCGLAQSFAEVMIELGNAVADRNRHPVARLWAAKLDSLANGECLCERCVSQFAIVYSKCRELAELLDHEERNER